MAALVSNRLEIAAEAEEAVANKSMGQARLISVQLNPIFEYALTVLIGGAKVKIGPVAARTGPLTP